MNNRPTRRGIVVGLSGHPIPKSVYKGISNSDNITEMFSFEQAFSLDFFADPMDEMDRLFGLLAEQKVSGICALSPCAQRYIVLPSLNSLSVLVMTAFSAIDSNRFPKIVIIRKDKDSQQHEFKKLIDMDRFKREWKPKGKQMHYRGAHAQKIQL